MYGGKVISGGFWDEVSSVAFSAVSVFRMRVDCHISAARMWTDETVGDTQRDSEPPVQPHQVDDCALIRVGLVKAIDKETRDICDVTTARCGQIGVLYL